MVIVAPACFPSKAQKTELVPKSVQEAGHSASRLTHELPRPTMVTLGPWQDGGIILQAPQDARVAELADAPDLGSGGETHGGSSPPFRTNTQLARGGKTIGATP